MKLYNSLSKSLEEFTPIKPNRVGIYTCGPTVYSYATIGNFRTYTTGDFIVRVLKYLGFDVDYIMNLTDVGHLTGDNEGDADTGEDRLEKSAKKEGKNAWDIARFYTDAFYKDFEALGLVKPRLFMKATDYIPEQIDLIMRLASNGLTYKISDGIYFDTEAYETKSGNKYGELSTLDEIKVGARVAPNKEKHNPRDFALWKFSEQVGSRHMEWDSPWGVGFPGWHIECSAMSIKELGETFDIHVGGEDLRSTHHPNEIAQSEGATGKKFVNYWMHSAFLKVDGKRMGKSLGNAYTVTDIVNRGYDPLALRYFYMTAHYKSVINFTWEALQASDAALTKLRNIYLALGNDRSVLSEEKTEKAEKFRGEFLQAISNDLNMPQALAVVWETLKSNIPSPDKRDLLLDFDEVLGLDLKNYSNKETQEEVNVLIKKRNKLRDEKKFDEADKVREKLIKMGYTVNDEQLAQD